MKKFLIAFLLPTLILFGLALQANSTEIEKADKLFAEGKFSKAKEIYDEIFTKSKDDEIKWKSFFRGVESMGLQFKYGEASNRAISQELPKNKNFAARLLFLKAGMLENFLSQYERYQRKDIVDEEGKDVFRMTPKEIKLKIEQTYHELWQMRETLSKIRMKDESYYFKIENIDFGMYPTLFDFLVLEWTNFIIVESNRHSRNTSEAEQFKKPNIESIAKKKFKHSVKFDDPAGLLIPSIFEEASKLYPEERLEATERLNIKRLILAYQNSYLYEVKDLNAILPEIRKILLSWMDSFKETESKAQAGYQAAMIYKRSGTFIEVVKLCETIVKKFPQTFHAKLAQKEIDEAKTPTLHMTTKNSSAPAKKSISITTKNLGTVYFRIYALNPETLAMEISKLGFSQNHQYEWQPLNQGPTTYWVEKYVNKKRPVKSFSFDIDEKNDYQTRYNTIDPPSLTEGVYLVLASNDKSFDIGSNLVSSAFINVTDLVLLVSQSRTYKSEHAYFKSIYKKGPHKIQDEIFRFHTVNANTGKPVKGSLIKTRFSYGIPGSDRVDGISKLKSLADGSANLSLPIGVHPHGNSWAQADPLAKNGKSYSYLQNIPQMNYYPESPIYVFIELDRPIYRPGHIVKGKVITLRKTQDGFKTLTAKDKVSIECNDPNYKEFFKKNLKLNEFGSAEFSFKIPEGRLLGNYTIEAASHSSDGFAKYHSEYFKVEEYKRPEFEITLNEAEKPWKYEKEALVKGSAKYYFGGPVSNAKIKYRIKRSIYIPWFYRYWFSGYSDQDQEIAAGDTQTDEKGDFTFKFTPTPSPYSSSYQNVPDISRFTIEVEGRDSGGRTIEGSKSYMAGKAGIYFAVETEKAFTLENEKIKFHVKRLTINDTAAKGTSSYEIFSLKEIPKESIHGYTNENRNFWNQTPAIDVQLKDVPNDKRLKKGKLDHDSTGISKLNISALKSGSYRIIIKSKDNWGEEIVQKKIFIVASKDKDINLPVFSTTLTEKDSYNVGETAKVLLGSKLTGGTYYLEFFKGDVFLYSKVVDSSKLINMHEFKITDKMKGGFTLRWVAVNDHKFYFGKTEISVPFSEQKLNIRLNPFKKELQPAEKANWGLKVTDIKRKPVSAEILALMYDRSLEYYATSNSIWLNTLYSKPYAPQWGNISIFQPSYGAFRVTKGLLNKMLSAFTRPLIYPPEPALRTYSTWGHIKMKSLMRDDDDYKFDGELAEMDKFADAPKPMSVSIVSGEKSLGLSKRRGAIDPFKKEYKKAKELQSIKARKEFSDTAFFIPHIITAKNGKAKFSFKAPEQLTSWRVKLFAFTKDAKQGVLVKEAVTKKDLMIRADIPRFFREKDIGTVTAIVHNESKKPMKGTLILEVKEKGKDISNKIKLKNTQRPFDIKPHGLESFDFKLEIPQGTGEYDVRVAAISEKLSDAEVRKLPILPSRQRLIESAFISLNGNQTKELKISLKEDTTRINESMILQIDPQLVLSILNSLPFLVQYPFECVEQILNKYVPLAITNEIYKKYPAIRKSVAKIPKRDTVTPPWEKNDPRRLQKLMETPWMWQSEGRPTIWPIIDLLDPKIVKTQKAITFDKLSSAQLSNGAFPWWPGGREDVYMTLYVLAGLSEAKRYGVNIPKKIISKALAYVNDKIPTILKPETRDLSTVAFAAYVVTSFSTNEFANAKAGHNAAKSWVVWLEKNIHALTAYGKAYLAYTQLRLGFKEKAYSTLEMAMDGAQEDEITGVFWAPEKYSWVWYSDSVEKHAFLLKTLQELKPSDKRIPGMVQWLLFNRKGNVWKSTKATSAAIFALLDFMSKSGALEKDENFSLNWGSLKQNFSVKADDWLSEPKRWIKKGKEITDKMATAKIDKKGPGIAFASMTWTYTTDQIADESEGGLIKLNRKFYLREKRGNDYHLKPVKSGDSVSVGDQIEVQLKINTRSQFEYMHLKDLKPAGFEGETLLSGWKYDPLWFYEEPRDSLTNFFIDWLPHGEYILRYRLRPTKPGIYRVGSSTLQSMYAPEMTAHSAGFMFKVVK